MTVSEEELAKLRADAERWRWLREQTWYKSEVCVVTRPRQSVKLGYVCPSHDLLDRLIDHMRGAFSGTPGEANR